MPAILEISDGTTSVDLLGTSLTLRRGGYKPLIGAETRTGVYEDVTETFVLNWHDTDDSARATTLTALHLLMDKAAESVRQNRAYDLVYLEAQGNSEVGVRYALVKGIRLAELPTALYGPERISRLQVEVTREGVWRQYVPGTYAYTDVAVATLENRSDGVNGNHYDIPATAVPGDARAMVITLSEGEKNTLIAMRSGATAMLNEFEPNFYTGVNNGTDATILLDGTVPEGVVAAFNSVAGSYIWWFLGGLVDTRPLDTYAGRYAVYALARMSAGSGQVRYRNFRGSPDLPWVTLDSTSVKMQYLGQAEVPHHGYTPHVGPLYGIDLYTIGLEVQNVTGGNMEIFGMVLVPVQELPSMLIVSDETTGAGGYNTVNGVDQKTYLLYDSLTPPPHADQQPTLLGDYMTLRPNVVNRLYFWWVGDDYAFDFAETHNVLAQTVGRYRGLR